MKRGTEIITGVATGLTLGLVVRVVLGAWAPPVEEGARTSAAPRNAVLPHSNPEMVSAEIRQTTQLPSVEGRAAVEAGSVRFVIRGGANSDETEVARILLDLGSVALCRDGETISVWRSGHWDPIRSLDQFSGYAVSRAWELANHEALGAASEQLSSSASTFLLMPLQQELRLVGAVEKALPAPLIDHTRIEIMVERTPGGHIRWTLQRVVRRDGAQMLSNTTLPI